MKVVPKPLRSFASGIYDGPHATPAEAADGPVYLGIDNISDDGRMRLSTVRHISEQEYPRWIRRVEPQPGDVVFSYEATLHRYAVIPDGFRGCLGRRLALVRPDPAKLDSRFLLYYFLTPQWRAIAGSAMISGATVDRLLLTQFPGLPVAFPPLDSQRRIASILSAYDDLIENNTRRIALLERAARTLYEEWFVRLRFPGRGRARIVDGAPRGWKCHAASEIIEVNPRTPAGSVESITYVPMSALSTSSMVANESDFERRDRATGARFRNGDVLLPRITPCLENGKTAMVDFLGEGEVACGSTEFIVLRGRSVPAAFTYCLARTPAFRDTAIKSMVGASGRQRVQEECFDDLRVLLPPRALVEAFDDFASPMFRQIRCLVVQNNRLKTARDLLLPRLMSGAISV